MHSSEIKRSPPSLRINLLFLVLGLVGVVINLIATSPFGSGLSPDSIGYIAAARNLVAGKGFSWYNGSPMDLWPPLYPTLLAIVDRIFEMDALQSVRIVNALVFGLIIYFTGRLFFKYLTSFPLLAILGTIYVLLSNSLFSVSVMAWSEPLFILFVILFLFSLDTYEEDKTSFAMTCLLAILACLTRYSGVTFIMSGIIIFWFLGTKNIKIRLKTGILFCCIAAFPLALWLIRNKIVCGTIAGYRESANNTVFNNLILMGSTLIQCLFPYKLLSTFQFQWVIVLTIIILLGLFISLFLAVNLQQLKPKLGKISPVVIFTIFYLGFQIITSTCIDLDPIDNRFVSPVFVPSVLIILFIIQLAVEIWQAKFISPKINRLLTVILATLLILPLHNTITNIKYLRYQGGKGYNSQIWRQSAMINYLQSHPLPTGVFIYSNDPYVLYLYNQIISTYTPGIKIILAELKGHWPEQSKSYLIWFNNSHQGYFHTPDELKSIVNLFPINQLSDGTIYTVDRIK